MIISIEVEDVEEVCLSIDKSSNNGNHSYSLDPASLEDDSLPEELLFPLD